jgi:hypothetical protein
MSVLTVFVKDWVVIHLQHPLPMYSFKRGTSMNTISEYQISVRIIQSHTSNLSVRTEEKEAGLDCATAFPEAIGCVAWSSVLKMKATYHAIRYKSTSSLLHHFIAAS